MQSNHNFGLEAKKEHSQKLCSRDEINALLLQASCNLLNNLHFHSLTLQTLLPFPMSPLSGLKRSMPCTDLSSMVMFPSPTASEKDYDSDDQSSNSCMVFSFKTHTKSSNIVRDDEDCFSDDVWNFSTADKMSTHKRQKCHNTEVDGTSSILSSSPATDLLNTVLSESQLTLDQFMDMKLDMLAPSSTPYHNQSCLMHKFSAKHVDMSRMARTLV